MFDCPRIILEKPEAWAFQLHPDPEGRTAWILAMLAFLLVKKRTNQWLQNMAIYVQDMSSEEVNKLLSRAARCFSFSLRNTLLFPRKSKNFNLDQWRLS